MNSIQPIQPKIESIGREAQLSELRAMLGGGQSNHVLTIEASRGMGKTHLMHKLAKAGEMQQHTVIKIDFDHAAEIDTIYLIRCIRDQLDAQSGLTNADKIALLNKAINAHTRSTNLPTAIGLNGQITTVSVNLETLKNNLGRLPIEQLAEMSDRLNITLPTKSEPEKTLVVDHLLSETIRLDLVSDLVAHARTASPDVAWWQQAPLHPGGIADMGGSLNQVDPAARRLAIGEISRALFRMVASIASNKPILMLVDGWNTAGDESQKWLFHWLIKPLCRAQLPGVKMVIAGRDLTALRVIDINASHTRLGPLSLKETHQFLVEKMGFHPDSNIEEIHTWSKGIPSVLETLVAVNQIQPDPHSEPDSS